MGTNKGQKVPTGKLKHGEAAFHTHSVCVALSISSGPRHLHCTAPDEYTDWLGVILLLDSQTVKAVACLQTAKPFEANCALFRQTWATLEKVDGSLENFPMDSHLG